MAATANITVSDAAESRSSTRRASHTAPAVLGGLAGCLLLALGLPGLVAGVSTLDARAVAWNVHNGVPRPTSELLAAAEAVALGNRWTRDSELDGDRGLLLLRAAEAAESDAERKKLLAAAAEATASALSNAPGQPSAWLRLAHIRHGQGEFAGAASALRMSMLSGSFVPALMATRIEMGLQLLPMLDRETLELLHRQIRQWWVVEPERVAKLAARPEATAIVRAALDSLTEADMARFQRLHGNRS
ncbi:hypothetical protein [Azospirillum sp. SYSU D00513]|uniref:hypothetical protein n=1 Tax=Azospirillum sp. SYSU D00513 TaxID=2812561 RepID=UPI001A962787|nr:hypothetical protein [Azospirillum sp. SYSU D00513]